MKVTADGILGSAQNINNRKKTEETGLKQDTKNIRTDSLDLGKVINSRIEALGKEVKDIQTSLTKNQIIRDGLDQMMTASSEGEKEKILNDTTYHGSKILKEFIAEGILPRDIEQKNNEIKTLISGDVNSLTRIQVEMDNINASELAGNKKVENLMAAVGDILKKSPAGIENISNLDADKVMKLIR